MPTHEVAERSRSEESQYWAGNEQVTQYLEENGINSVEDILQYTANQEQTAEQYQEIFTYALHPDPEIRAAFWENYQQALDSQGGGERSLVAPQSPSFPGTPNNGYSRQYPDQPQFASLQQLDQAHRLMQSGLPGITPQQLAEFDRAILSTPGQFWGQQIFNAGDI